LKGALVLETGEVFPGTVMGSCQQGYGEVVFNTGMTGYQEILTDPSYASQIVVMTYPLIGNYGINGDDFESWRPWMSGFVTSEVCMAPNHYKCGRTVHTYLQEHGVAGLTDVDTRAVVRAIRKAGSVRGWIVPDYRGESLKFPALPRGLVHRVTVKEPYIASAEGNCHVVLFDLGAKQNIIQSLVAHGCRVTVVPATTSAAEVEALRPDGIMLSNGPGDPMHCMEIVPTVAELAIQYPTFGICLGHQLLAIAFGAKTGRLPYGHRGSNHPVRDLESGLVRITSQNHGYTVLDEGLPADLIVTHRNVNDGTIEGLRHRKYRVFSVQYHPEACPGPQDSEYLFSRFVAEMEEWRGSRLAFAT
jgi:carbamoyl-phosphate synthase small subunit